jgi:hypothetical protein
LTDSSPAVSSAPALGNTRVRHKVLAMTMALGAITYLDRVTISVTRPHIARDLNLSPTEMGYVFSAFYLAYALFEIPSGWWGDRVGTRRVLTRIVCWWSAFTVLTGAAFNFSSMIAIRFLFGAGEAGALPNVARTLSRWFPRQERGTAQGIFFMSMHLAGGLTPVLVTALLVYFEWRTLFALFGSLGFVWSVAWYRWFRDAPAEHSSVGKAERDLIERGLGADTGRALGATDWKRLLWNRTVVCLCLMYFTQAFGGAFYVTWLPTYLASRGLTGTRRAAADPQLRRRSPRRHRHRSSRAPARAAARTHHHRRRRAGGRRPVHHCRGVGRIAGRGGCTRSGVGHVRRHRRPPLGRRERGHEYVRPGRRDPQPDPRRGSRAAVLAVERAALRNRRALPAGCAVLAVGRPDEACL